VRPIASSISHAWCARKHHEQCGLGKGVENIGRKRAEMAARRNA